MKVYKGTDENMKCRGLQYQQGVEVKEDRAELCTAGLHACEAPLDVLGYYPPNNSRYFEAEAADVSPERREDSKIVCKRLTLGAEIGIAGLAKSHVEYVQEHLDKNAAPATNTGDLSAATNTGNRSAATNTGNQSVATNTGDLSAATNTGDLSAATNTGNRSAATNTGNRSAATNTGDLSAATAGGKGSVAIVTGYHSKARAALGCAICICERSNDGTLLAIKAAIVDGVTIKADTWYTLVNGEFRELEED